MSAQLPYRAGSSAIKLELSSAADFAARVWGMAEGGASQREARSRSKRVTAVLIATSRTPPGFFQFNGCIVISGGSGLSRVWYSSLIRT